MTTMSSEVYDPASEARAIRKLREVMENWIEIKLVSDWSKPKSDPSGLVSLDEIRAYIASNGAVVPKAFRAEQANIAAVAEASGQGTRKP